MKEIDFLPEWYKSGERRLSNYHTIYVAVVGVFVLVAVSSFITARAVSKARAELNQRQTACTTRSDGSKEHAELKSELAGLAGQADILERLDSKIDICNVLGELSFLIDEKIVLSKVRLQAEPFGGGKSASPHLPQRVRTAWASGGRILSRPVRLAGRNDKRCNDRQAP